MEIFHPSVRGDTLLGDTLGPAGLPGARKRIAVGIPFTDIDSVSQREINAPMTALAVAAATGGVIFLVIKGVEALEKSADESKQSCNNVHFHV